MSSTERIGFGVAVALGILVRALPILSAPAAIGDGGLFLAMVGDVRAAGIAIPGTTTYNGLGIPFVYPPGAIAVAAVVGELTGAATLDLLRWMPLILSILGLGAFAWMARRILPVPAAIGATLAYALMPHAYDWVISGGGLTRATGVLFALLAIGLAADRRPGARVAVGVGALLGLSVLSHPQAAVLGVIGCVAVSVSPPFGPWLRRLGIAAAAALAVALPWLVGVATTHGADALFTAGHRLNAEAGLIRTLNLRFSGAPFMDVFAVFGLVGLVACLARRELRVPAILLGIYLVGPGGGEFLASVPWSLLAGIGAAAVADLVHASLADAQPARRAAWRIGIAAILLFLALIGSLGSAAGSSSKLVGLSEGHLEAMWWVADSAPSDARFIVPTSEVWGDDEMSEWFPALASRSSVGTVQGSEWLGTAPFATQLRAHQAILGCEGDTAACYRQIDSGAWVFVPKGRLGGMYSPDDCCPALRATLEDAGYEVVYDGRGATIAVPAGNPGARRDGRSRW